MSIAELFFLAAGLALDSFGLGACPLAAFAARSKYECQNHKISGRLYIL